VFLP
jgi:hypothetical protein